jgi:hypothetical protein
VSAHNILDHGALPGGETLCTAAVQQAVDAAHAAGGGTVIVPGGGAFLIGTIQLKSNVHLQLQPGATLLGSDRREHYRPTLVGGEYSAGESAFLLEARDAENISITGPGAIDARGRLFMDGYRSADGPYIFQPKPWRPRMIGFYGCRRVSFRDATLRDAASWCMHLTGCDDVLISGVRILNNLAIPNCDGIDPDHCTNVRISDCHIEAGDDCIVIKATRTGAAMGYRGSHNIAITNCTCISTSAALKIGTETHADSSHILFNNCIVRSSSRGLAIQVRDHGNVEDVIFSNCLVQTRLFHDAWWGRAEPIYVTALPRHDGQQRVGRVRNIRFHNIQCRSENGVFIAGSPDSPIENLTLDNVRVDIDKWSRWPGGWHDRRPIAGREHGGLSKAPTHGVYVQHARDIRLSHVQIAWGANRQPDWSKPLHTDHVENLRLDHFSGNDPAAD